MMILSLTWLAIQVSTIVPVLLSLGEYLEFSGKDLLTAYVAGFEIGTRINLGVMDEHYKRGDITLLLLVL